MSELLMLYVAFSYVVVFLMVAGIWGEIDKMGKAKSTFWLLVSPLSFIVGLWMAVTIRRLLEEN